MYSDITIHCNYEIYKLEYMYISMIFSRCDEIDSNVYRLRYWKHLGQLYKQYVMWAKNLLARMNSCYRVILICRCFLCFSSAIVRYNRTVIDATIYEFNKIFSLIRKQAIKTIVWLSVSSYYVLSIHIYLVYDKYLTNRYFLTLISNTISSCDLC